MSATTYVSVHPRVGTHVDVRIQPHGSDEPIAAVSIGDTTIQGSPSVLDALLQQARAALTTARAGFDGEAVAQLGFELTLPAEDVAERILAVTPGEFSPDEVAQTFHIPPETLEDRSLEPCERGSD